jgi:hypothetical protein
MAKIEEKVMHKFFVDRVSPSIRYNYPNITDSEIESLFKVDVSSMQVFYRAAGDNPGDADVWLNIGAFFSKQDIEDMEALSSNYNSYPGYNNNSTVVNKDPDLCFNCRHIGLLDDKCSKHQKMVQNRRAETCSSHERC